MIEQNFGTKELYQVALKANSDMNFGYRKITTGEPVLYFDKVDMAQLNEMARAIAAKGGWGNMPHVIWEDRSEMSFSLDDGVMNQIGMGLI